MREMAKTSGGDKTDSVWLDLRLLRCVAKTKLVYFLSRLFSFKQLLGEGELDTWYLETMYVFHRDGIIVFAEGYRGQ